MTKSQQYGNKSHWTSFVKNNFNFEAVLFDHMLRTNSGQTISEYKRNIDILEVMMSPYIDKTYNNKIKEAEAKYMQDLRKYNGAKIPENLFWQQEWLLIKAKYAALMFLAFSRRLMPQYELSEKVIGEEYDGGD